MRFKVAQDEVGCGVWLPFSITDSSTRRCWRSCKRRGCGSLRRILSLRMGRPRRPLGSCGVMASACSCGSGGWCMRLMCFRRVMSLASTVVWLRRCHPLGCSSRRASGKSLGTSGVRLPFWLFRILIRSVLRKFPYVFDIPMLCHLRVALGVPLCIFASILCECPHPPTGAGGRSNSVCPFEREREGCDPATCGTTPLPWAYMLILRLILRYTVIPSDVRGGGGAPSWYGAYIPSICQCLPTRRAFFRTGPFSTTASVWLGWSFRTFRPLFWHTPFSKAPYIGAVLKGPTGRIWSL